MNTKPAINLNSTKQRVAAIDCDMSGSTFTDVKLADAAFNDVNLAGATIHDVNLLRSQNQPS